MICAAAKDNRSEPGAVCSEVSWWVTGGGGGGGGGYSVTSYSLVPSDFRYSQTNTFQNLRVLM